MGAQRETSLAIQDFILENVGDHPRDIVALTAGEFDISRQAAQRHVRKLVDADVLVAEGQTRARRYTLKYLASHSVELPVTPDLAEDQIWRQHVRPHLEGVAPNVIDVCQYGFTEMLNNVVDHSEGQKAVVSLEYKADSVQMAVSDDGIGIFRKIQTAFDLDDPRYAILELAKGKLTTDPERHTGEGIFFTSRAFDEFIIFSRNLLFSHTPADDDWLLESNGDQTHAGTLVRMRIHPQSNRKLEDVFDQYTAQDDDYGFTKTRVPVSLARYGDENLISRSQAKRLLARFDRFKEVVLDFEGVDIIGQAFADEVFRVFSQAHPEVNLQVVNTNDRVKTMILRALAR